MKLELEHLAKRLPFGLKVRLSQIGIFNLDSEYPNEHKNKVGELESIYLGIKPDFSMSGSFKVSQNYSFDFDDINEIEILLRPLYDLTKEIEHNGERLRVSDLIDNGRWQNWIYNHSKITKDKLLDCPQWIMDIFLKYHFDVDFLIELGNAIDVNTLEVNPYK